MSNVMPIELEDNPGSTTSVDDLIEVNAQVSRTPSGSGLDLLAPANNELALGKETSALPCAASVTHSLRNGDVRCR
jgi:hypothetical protein